MPRNKVPLTKATLNFRAGDLDKLEALFPDMGKTVAVRKIISAFIDKHYAEPTQLPEIEDTIEL